MVGETQWNMEREADAWEELTLAVERIASVLERMERER